MKPSELLVEAAKLVNNGYVIGGCGALFFVKSGSLTEKTRKCASDKYFSLFINDSPCSFWWKKEYKNEARILGLLFAAAIAESEGN